jgi:mRNA-degrading endonuclease RelE of RelBE toxin-antitoxin system
MSFKIRLTAKAAEHLEQLQHDASKKRILKAVLKTLAYMEANLRHPSLNTHEYYSIQGPNGEKVYEAYAQQKTPGAYRIFWYYGPEKNMISIVAIMPHP